MLKTEQDTPEMRDRIGDAFASSDMADDGDGPLDFDVFFEHGAHWVRLAGSGRTWAVVDAEGKDTVDGFGFELIDEGEEG